MPNSITVAVYCIAIAAILFVGVMLTGEPIFIECNINTAC